LPSNGAPIVLDFGTSAKSYFHLVQAAADKRAIARDIGFDANGNETTEAAAIIADGAMRSFDRGPAGAGLALIVESLAGGLVGAGLDVPPLAGPADTHGSFHDQWSVCLPLATRTVAPFVYTLIMLGVN
jgi:LDH2 family malate/lactate/ureidoglycolate dehydrogenase